MLSQLALSGIFGYQRWFSPRKGYGCAYRMRHGGTGCSGFAKQAIRELGLWQAIGPIRSRFAACHLAARPSDKEDGPTDRAKETQRRLDKKLNAWELGCCATCAVLDR